MLHPIIDIRGPKIVLNFHVDWSGSSVQATARLGQTNRRTDRQRDRHTYEHRHRLKSSHYVVRALEQHYAVSNSVSFPLTLSDFEGHFRWFAF